MSEERAEKLRADLIAFHEEMIDKCYEQDASSDEIIRDSLAGMVALKVKYRIPLKERDLDSLILPSAGAAP
jgi:hypothetical protein